MFSLRLVCLDSYQAAPIADVDPAFSHFRGSEIKQVPILRVFGITPDGDKVCLHVHGVFPYMYVPYSGQIKPEILMYQLATALDASINVTLGSAKANTQHVYKIQQVSGIPFYGYHRKNHHYFKIYMYNPAMTRKAAELLQSGCILDHSFQPHESHIPFTQQFMIDFNLYGMSMINLRNVKYRHHATMSQNEGKSSYNSDEVLDFAHEEKEYLPFSVIRQSVCKVEVDAWASDVLNREVIDKGIDQNPGITAIWEEEKARRAQAGLGGSSQLTYPESPARTQAKRLQTDNDIYQAKRLAQRLCALESQGDESTLTPGSESTSYPIPVADNSNLLNASQLEIHAGPLDTTSHQRSINQSHQDFNESMQYTLQSQASFGELSLNSSDLDVVDILANLAKDQEEASNSVDANSILGTQKSEIDCQDLDLKEGENVEEEEEEVPDLNMTNLELDNINFSQWENSPFSLEKLQQANVNSDSQIELVLGTWKDSAESHSSDDIPQLDGPIDDENAKMGPDDDDDDNDKTIERQEFLICELRSSRGGRRSTSVTPSKRKRTPSSDEDSRGSEKKFKTKDPLPRTPKRSPNKRRSKLTSPSCPTRTYSPLSLEITPGQRTPKGSHTPKTSPCASPSISIDDRRKLRDSFRRRTMFSPVKESKLEEEHTSEDSSKPSTSTSSFFKEFNLEKESISKDAQKPSTSTSGLLSRSKYDSGIDKPSTSTLGLLSEKKYDSDINKPSTSTTDLSERKFDLDIDKPSTSTSGHLSKSKLDSDIDKPSTSTSDHLSKSKLDSDNDKSCTSTSGLLFARKDDSDGDKLSSKTSEELFIRNKEDPDSDETLVEDSDDSLHTLVPSPRREPVIINDSDTNDSISSKERLSNLSSYNFPHETLHPVPEEEPKVDISFSQIPEVQPKEQESQRLSFSVLKGTDEKVVITQRFVAPSRQEVIASMEKPSTSKCHNIPPFFSNEEDAKQQPRFKMPTDPLQKAKDLGQANLPPFKGAIDIGTYCKMIKNQGAMPSKKKLICLRSTLQPPSRESIFEWVENMKKQKIEEEAAKKKQAEDALLDKSSQKSEESSNNSTLLDASVSLSKLFKDFPGRDASKHLGVSCGQIEFQTRSSIIDVADGNLGNAKALTTHQYLTIFCLEVHVNTRPNLLPDPKHDPVEAIFYSIHNDVPPDWSKAKPLECGAIIVDAERVNSKKLNLTGTPEDEQAIIYVENEVAMLESLLTVIERSDPEMLIGWDVDIFSWGYLFQRASLLGKNLGSRISRIPKAKCSWEQPRENSDMIVEYLAEVRLPGRIVLEIWRIMKYEIALTSYTYENVMYHVMNERIPQPSFDKLTEWWKSPLTQWRVIDHYANKVIGIHRLLHHLDIINRTSEHARLYGVLFYEVFSRGSQFRVESMMLRLAKPMNYIPVSPTPQQRHGMRAPECLPLIMEPESTMYVDPVIVLDFQSLYPSIIIAYNYCFSTCLGRVQFIGSSQPFEFGCTHLKVQKNLALKLQKKINFAPCGVAYVKPEVRRGILPKMLTEILETRLMVKKAIKDHPKEDRALQRALHSRQLGLKLIANVTYGYTSANFSGRMPCIEVGDSVVSKGKETLERAIKLVESTPKWGARVIYGDTDSLFVLVKGKSREEAFEIGAEIADAVTAMNPKPVKLKFEKVMMPCILQTKKRYCGYMYENLNDKPVYLAKGIETVRRDGCPAVAKILEKSLRILFETKDLSQVKQFVIRQLDKVLSGKASIQDLTFAKEFRGMRGYKAAACVPALELTKRLVQKDPRAVPRTGSRVPYIIVNGGPNEPLIRCVRGPMELIRDPSLRPNATYYITKVIIPPLNRCLNLIGVDVMIWFMEMPHRQALNRVQGTNLLNCNRKQKTTISQYLCNTTCPSCGQSCDKGICAECISRKSQTLIVLHEKCRQYERIYSNIKMICESCIGVMDADSCFSLDCPIFYRRIQAQRDNSQVPYLYNLIKCMEY